MDMVLDMTDAELALGGVLGLIPPDQISPLALTRSDNYTLDIDDVMVLAQKINLARTGLAAPTPLLQGLDITPYAEVLCGYTGIAEVSISSLSPDATLLTDWPVSVIQDYDTTYFINVLSTPVFIYPEGADYVAHFDWLAICIDGLAGWVTITSQAIRYDSEGANPYAQSFYSYVYTWWY